MEMHSVFNINTVMMIVGQAMFAVYDIRHLCYKLSLYWALGHQFQKTQCHMVSKGPNA